MSGKSDMEKLSYPDRRLVEQCLAGECEVKHLTKELRHVYDNVRKDAKSSSDGDKGKGQEN